MENTDALFEAIKILGVVFGVVSSIITSVIMVTAIILSGKYHSQRIDEKLTEMKQEFKDASKKVDDLAVNSVSRDRFEDVLFKGPDSVDGRIKNLDTRLTKAETACNERHRGRRVPEAG